jgi:hypothetical protein
MNIAFYAGVMLVLAMGMIWYNEGDPRNNVTRTVITHEVVQGEEFAIRLKATMEQTCEVDIQRSIVDSEGTLHTSVGMRVERDKGVSTVVIKSTVPSAAAPGLAFYRVTLAWRCNPLQRMWPRVVQLPDLAFIIRRASQL